MTARLLALTAALAILLPTLAQATPQDDVSILTTAVPPNVVLLLDTSGSMQFVINHDTFNDNSVRWQFNDREPLRLYDDDDGTYCSFGTVPEQASTTGLCPGSDHASGDDRCPDTDDFGTRRSGGNWYYCNNMPGGCANAPTGWTCTVSSGRTWLQLPSFGPNYSSDYQRNYLHWIAQQMHAGNQLTLPTSDRMLSAKTAIKNLIDAVNPPGLNKSVNFGLARFDVSSNGGYVLVAPDPNSRDDIFARLDSTGSGYNDTFPNGGTPLSETLVDIGRYYVGSELLGDYSAYNRNDWTGNVPPSPIDAKCRANFVVVMTDGAPTSDLNNHHGGDFTSTIGNADGDTNENPDPWSGRTPTNYVLPYDTNSGSDWLDDVAYYLANNDLIDDTVMEEEQHVITYSVGFTIDHPLLSETAANGLGEYFTTSNALQLQDDLEAALTSIIERGSSLTSATVPASRSAFGDGFYTAFFVPSTTNPFWEGHLQAFRLTPDLQIVDPNGNPAIDPATNLFVEPRSPFWDAGDELASASHPARNLYATKSGARADFTAATIDDTDLSLVSADLTAYPNDPAVPFANLAALADGIVNYMRGEDAFDDDRDSDATEKRAAVLGDIFHSNPISVGPPPAALKDEDGFGPVDTVNTFLYKYGKRKRRLFAGSNGGFLHAFDGGSYQSGDNPGTPETETGYYDLGTGQEVFGYVPGFLLDDVKMIPRNKPRTSYYVDGSPSAADIWVPANGSDVTKEGTEWTTTLVTGMRQGGAGYLALDVTDPLGAAPHGPYPKFMWEFDDTSEPLGDTWSEPVITRVRMKGDAGVGDFCGKDDSDDGDCREQWVVIVGGGYKQEGDPNLTTWADPNDAAWTANSKAIFMLKADTGDVLAKVAYDPNDTTLSRMIYSMPSTPGVLDLDFDGFADVVYIGDLGGQLWKWDISAKGLDLDVDGQVDDGVWPAGIVFASPAANVGDVDGDGNDDFHFHSIFFPPIATFIDNKLLLAFASGERTALSYEGAPSVPATLEGLYDDNNRFWVMWDRVPTGTGAFAIELFEGYQTIGGQTRGLNDISALTSDPNPDDDGYYIKLPDGEKFVVNHVVFGGFTLALSYMPDNNPTDICNAKGETNVYLFGISDGTGALSSGGSSTRSVKLGNGAPTDPRVSVSRDSSGNMIVELVGQTSLGEILKLPIPADPPTPFDNVYWRQRF